MVLDKYIQSDPQIMFPSLVPVKSCTTYNQQKNKNRLWGGAYLVVEMFSMDMPG